MIGSALASLYQRRDSRVIRTRTVDLPRRTGLRIVLASDLHARDDWFPERCVAALVDRINEVPDADLAVLVGDFVGDEPAAIDWAAPVLGRIEVPTYATLGNHDHWTDAPRISAALSKAGIRMLTNESVEVGNGAWLAGIDSCWGGAPDAEAALSAVPDDAPVVVLGHEPHLATLHDRWLHLAGHTHHGQVRIPGLSGGGSTRFYPRYSEPYPRGRYDLPGDRVVYTTAGVGYSTVSWRFNCPPEIVVIDA